ncbi:MAG TPA: hypothetical protein VK053_12805 [Jiangellaceae bacterium]|nr:hypothetical protein [Jiangellaceae bacterium]
MDVTVNLGPDPVSVDMPAPTEILLAAVPGESFVVTARVGRAGWVGALFLLAW